MTTHSMSVARAAPKLSALLSAAQLGDAQKLRAQLDAGVDVDATDNWGQTALMTAAFGGALECLSQLISAGARLNAADSGGHTAAMLAAWDGRVECLRALVDAGADLEAKDNEGRTAAMLAAQNCHDGLAAFLSGLARSRHESAAIRQACGQEQAPPEPTRPRVRV